MNLIEKDLEKKEFLIYEKHGLKTQVIFDKTDLDTFNLEKKPSW